MKPGPAALVGGDTSSIAANIAAMRHERLALELTTTDPVFRSGTVVTDRRHRRVPVDVAGARAVAQFAGGVLRAGAADFGMRTGLKVVGMATGAVRLERSVSPVHGFRVVLVAAAAGHGRVW